MTARVLVVDDVRANLLALQARLQSEYLDVVTAGSGPEALHLMTAGAPDLLLMDVLMPGMSGFEVCRRIKSAPETTHVPVVFLTSLDRAEDRVVALDSGGDDFLTKPIQPSWLMARVRSLIRQKQVTDELRRDEGTGREMGLSNADRTTMASVSASDGRVLAIVDNQELVDVVWGALSPDHRVLFEHDVEHALLLAQRVEFDVILVSATPGGVDGLRVCSRLRAMQETRNTPLLALAGLPKPALAVRALDLGVDGFLSSPLNSAELGARVRAQLRAKRFRDGLREHVRSSFEKAITDPLTVLRNRRHLDVHLPRMVTKGVEQDRPISLLLMDVDHFKAVNDQYGHDVGDEVLVQVAKRISSSLRGIDLCCRYGGEEFVAVLWDTDPGRAHAIAERLRTEVAGESLTNSGDRGPLAVTISVGVATSGPDETAETLLRRADTALYRAKEGGRNRVVDAE